MRGVWATKACRDQRGAATVEYAVATALVVAAAVAVSAGLTAQSRVVVDRDAGCIAVRPAPAWCHPAVESP